MSEQKRAFPQGLVLGLTMAETAILIIFVLLLALTVLLGRETDRRQAVEQELEQLREIQLTLKQRDMSVAEVSDLIETATIDQADAEHWRELVRSLNDSVADPSPEAIISQLNDARSVLAREDTNNALDELLASANLQASTETLNGLASVLQAGSEYGMAPDDMRDAIQTRHKLNKVLEEDDGKTVSTHRLEDLVRNGERWRDLAAKVGEDPEAELERLIARIAEIESKLGGTGTDHPSCWYDEDNTVAYLFDVALTDDGFLLQPAHAPDHHENRKSLPLDDVAIGKNINPNQFLIQTRPVFQWSVDNGCRFFVRAFDLTAPEQKELYKTRMRTLESRFYKNASPSGPPPSADPLPQHLP